MNISVQDFVARTTAAQDFAAKTTQDSQDCDFCEMLEQAAKGDVAATTDDVAENCGETDDAAENFAEMPLSDADEGEKLDGDELAEKRTKPGRETACDGENKRTSKKIIDMLAEKLPLEKQDVRPKKSMKIKDEKKNLEDAADDKRNFDATAIVNIQSFAADFADAAELGGDFENGGDDEPKVDADLNVETKGGEFGTVAFEMPTAHFEERIVINDERNFDAKDGGGDKKGERQAVKKEIKLEDDGSATAILSLQGGEKTAEISTATGGQNVQAARGGNSFEQLLSAQLREEADFFVQAGMLTLKDADSGSINLVLKPENLGNVKIKLDLADKVLSAKIVVATREAFNAFSENMDSLRQAFNSQGFEAQDFDLSWSGNSTGRDDGRREGGFARASAGTDEGGDAESENVVTYPYYEGSRIQVWA